MAIDAYNMSVRLPVDSTHNTVTKPRETMEYKGKTFELFEPPKPTIPELKEKVKEHFRPCPKGGK